jgi:hypothetical protein
MALVFSWMTVIDPTLRKELEFEFREWSFKLVASQTATTTGSAF